MANPLTVQSTISGLIRKKTDGNADLSVLLDLIPFPVFLYDRSREQIIGINLEFQKVTGIIDLVNLSPFSILPDFDFSNFQDNRIYFSFLQDKQKIRNPAVIRIKEFDAKRQIFGFVIDSSTKQIDDDQKKLESVIQGVKKIADIFDFEGVPNPYSALLDALNLIFGADTIGIYRADTTAPRLICVSQSPEVKIFPDVIPSSDLVRLSSTVIWMPGKRMISDIHKIGRIAGLKYVVSTPLGQSGRWVGLLVVADTKKDSLSGIQPFIELTAAIVAKFFDHNLLIENLKTEIKNQSDYIFIQSQLFENLIEGLLLVGPDLLIHRINRTAEWMLGYADWEVKGKPLDHILISQDRLMHAFEAAQQGTAIPNSGTVSLHRRNGQSFPAQVKLYPIEKEGEIKSILVFVEDISENEQIKAQAQHLEHRALLGEVTAVFAHEVRNPLNNLSTGLQLMSSRLPQEDPNQELISRLQNDCNRMSHLMESVLIYARQSEYKLEQLDIAQYIKRLLDRWQPRLAKVSINWYFLSVEGNTYIKGDPRALEQVFTNLLSNAIEAMAKTGGTLAIKVTPISIIPNYPQVEITVSDNGPGIPEEIRDRVFEPFLTTKPQGTGLGLAITKRIVIGHKGNITVDSFPGGTVFKIVIPAVNGDSQ